MEENGNKVNLEERGKTIIRAGIIGILANLVLASFKVLIGLLSKSISIILDGVNNLTDAWDVPTHFDTPRRNRNEGKREAPA